MLLRIMSCECRLCCRCPLFARGWEIYDASRSPNNRQTPLVEEDQPTPAAAQSCRAIGALVDGFSRLYNRNYLEGGFTKTEIAESDHFVL